MANPVIGYVDCAHCGELLTVHREARGMRVMYYRCYGPDGMSMRCGTVQIRGPSGQVWIEENMRSGPDVGRVDREAANDEQWERRRSGLTRAASDGGMEKVKEKRRRGLLDLVPGGWNDD